MSTGRLALIALVAAAATTSLLLLALRSSDEPTALRRPVHPAFVVPPPTPLGARQIARWAIVLRPVAARSAPAATAAVVERLQTRTPEGTPNLVLVLENASSGATSWARIRLAVLPANTTGWVPRSALGGYHVVHTHLEIDRSRLRATLFRYGKPIFRAPVGVGKPASPTPSGRFYVRNRLDDFRSRFYGPLAFGTSARSSVLTDWPAGGFVGIHGTDRPELLPGRVSHGCIRMRNADIVKLGRLMPIGTPLTIR